jgi:hypothetical protein
VRKAAFLAASVALFACGGKGAIFLTIEATGPDGSLKIPDDVDKVAVKVTNPEGTNILLEKDYPLTSEQRFPLTLGLEPGGQTGPRVKIELHAFKAEQPVAETNSLVPINAQEVTSVTLRILKE